MYSDSIGGVVSTQPVPPPRPWIAYYADWSGFAIFPTEVEALRHCVKEQMHAVAQVTWGEDPRHAS